jgi:hypothetical protein
MASWKKVVVESATDTIAQNTAGNAATVTTNANLTGHVTSSGNATVLGAFTVAQLSAAISDANLSGDNTGDQTTVSGNAGTATALASAQNFSITGEVAASAISFDGTGAVALAATVANGVIDEANLKVSNDPTNGFILSAQSGAAGGMTWVSAGSAPSDAQITLSPGAGMADIGAFTLNQGAETIVIAVDGVLEDLDTLGAPTADGQFIVASAAGEFAYESAATVRTSLGLGTGDDVQFVDLTLTGDLSVQGSVTSIETTNLEVTDQFILLNNAASPTNADAGIVVEGSTKSVAYGYDQDADRWAIMSTGATSGMTSISPSAYAVNAHTGSAIGNAVSGLEQYGNIFTTTAGLIYIYS